MKGIAASFLTMLLAVAAVPAAAQFGPLQTLYRDRVQSFAGTLDVHGVASGTVTDPVGNTIQYTTDQHVSGILTLNAWDPLTASWTGTLAGTITINETAIITTPAGCTITNTLTASTSAAKDFLGNPLIFHLSLDIGGSDTWSLWPSNNDVNGNEHSVQVCAGQTLTSDSTVPMAFMPIGQTLGFPFAASPPPFDLVGSQTRVYPFGNAASNPVTYTYTYNLKATTYPCNYSFSAPSEAFSSLASAGSVGVNTGPSCPWTVTLPAPWVTVTSPTTGSGPGKVDFTVSANSGADRSTTIGVGGATFTIDQGGPGYFTVTPCRQLDTRSGAGTPIASGGTLTVPLAGTPCGLPPGAMAVSVNLTVTEQTAQGFLAIYPADHPQPLISNINFKVGLSRANNAVLRLSSDGTGRVKIYNGSGGTVHVIIDVNGYFQ